MNSYCVLVLILVLVGAPTRTLERFAGRLPLNRVCVRAVAITAPRRTACRSTPSSREIFHVTWGKMPAKQHRVFSVSSRVQILRIEVMHPRVWQKLKSVSAGWGARGGTPAVSVAMPLHPIVGTVCCNIVHHTAQGGVIAASQRNLSQRTRLLQLVSRPETKQCHMKFGQRHGRQARSVLNCPTQSKRLGNDDRRCAL